jgi:hypothetical protein
MKNLNICTRWKPLVFDAFRKKCKLSEFSDCFKYLIVKLRKILWWVTYTYTTRIPILKNCIFYDQCHRKLIDLEVLKFEYLSWLYSLRLWSRQILYSRTASAGKKQQQIHLIFKIRHFQMNELPRTQTLNLISEWVIISVIS